MQIDTAQPFEELLYAWGRWHGNCDEVSEVGIYKVQPFAPKNGGFTSSVDEELLLKIDRTIAKYFCKDKQLLKILECRYKRCLEHEDIVRYFNRKSKNDSKYARPTNKMWTVNYLKKLLSESIHQIGLDIMGESVEFSL